MVPIVNEFLAPEAPAFVPALAALAALCAFVVAVGLVRMVDALVSSLLGFIASIVGGIPFVGAGVRRIIRDTEHAVSHAFGAAEQYLDAKIGHSWHSFAALLNHLWKLNVSAALLLYHLARRVATHVTWHELFSLLRDVTDPLDTLIRVGRAIERALMHRVHAIEHTIATGVYPRLKVIERQWERTAQRELKSTRELAKEAEALALRDWAILRTRPWDIATKAFVGAVAIALAALGGGWIRCRNWNRIGRHVCGLPLKLIEDLLSFALAFLVVVDPVVLAEASLKVEAGMDELIRELAEPSAEATRLTREAVSLIESIL